MPLSIMKIFFFYFIKLNRKQGKKKTKNKTVTYKICYNIILQDRNECSYLLDYNSNITKNIFLLKLFTFSEICNIGKMFGLQKE